MNDTLSQPKMVNDCVPKLLEFIIPSEYLGKVIGPKGRSLQSFITTYNLSNINVDDNGVIQIESNSDEKNEATKVAILQSLAADGFYIDDITNSTTFEEPMVGVIYRDCEIKSCLSVGVIVEFVPGYLGLVHVSELDLKKVCHTISHEWSM